MSSVLNHSSMSGCHLLATELSRVELTKWHLFRSHCIHSGDISKHSCFNDLFRTSTWHSSDGPSNSFFFY